MRVDQMILLFGLLAALAAYFYFKRSKKKRLYGQTYDDDGPPASNKLETEGTTPEKLTFKKRLGGIAFLTVWLSIWSFGVFAAGSMWLSMKYGDVGYVFLIIWLIFAIPAWFFAAWTLFRLLRGDNVAFEFDGDSN